MILYETTFIVNPQSDDAVIEEKVKAVSELISSNGGKIVHEDRLGTRRLAYPINKLHQGYYATFLHESDKSVLPILDRHMKLGEEYMRHLTIRFEADPERVYGDKKEEETMYRKPSKSKVVEKPQEPEKTEKTDKPEIEGPDLDSIEPVSDAANTESAESSGETTEISIVSSTEEAASEEKKPADDKPEDEEL